MDHTGTMADRDRSPYIKWIIQEPWQIEIEALPN